MYKLKQFLQIFGNADFREQQLVAPNMAVRFCIKSYDTVPILLV